LLAVLQASNHMHSREISQIIATVIEIAIAIEVIVIEANVIVETEVSEILMVLAIALFPPPRRTNPSTPRSKTPRLVS